MEITGKNIVITGAGSGIGAAMARRFAAEHPASLTLADINGEAAREVAGDVAGLAIEIDVAERTGNDHLIDTAQNEFGVIDLFCANAGIGFAGTEQAPAEVWDQVWSVNVMSHVHAAARLIPQWVERGDGYFLSTASAAGLLTNLMAAEYSVTKHAAVAFSEWLAITYGQRGVKVSCLCPMGVETPLLDAASDLRRLVGSDMLQPGEVADMVVAGLRAEDFLILPHPEVARFVRNKSEDHDKWIAGMQKLQSAVFPD